MCDKSASEVYALNKVGERSFDVISLLTFLIAIE